MESKLIKEIPGIRELIARFHASISKHHDGGTVKINRIKFGSYSGVSGTGEIFSSYSVQFIRRTFSLRNIFYQLDGQQLIRLRLMRRYFDEIEEAINHLDEHIEVEKKNRRDKHDARLLKKRARIKSIWEANDD